MVMGQDAVGAAFGDQFPIVLETIERTDQQDEMGSHLAEGLLHRKEGLPDLERRDILANRGKMAQAAIDSLKPDLVVEQRVANGAIGTPNDSAVAGQEDFVRLSSQAAKASA